MAVEQRVTWRSSAFAGFWQRAAGALIDGMLWLVAYFTVLLVVALAGRGVGADPDAFATTAGNLVNLVFILGYITYDAVLTARNGGTIGKRAAGIEVRTVDGALLGYGLAFGRVLARAVSAVPFFIGFLWPVFDERKQTLHDKVCSTVVVKSAEVAPIGPTGAAASVGSAAAAAGWGDPAVGAPADGGAAATAPSRSGASPAGASPVGAWRGSDDAPQGGREPTGAGWPPGGVSGATMETATWGRPDAGAQEAHLGQTDPAGAAGGEDGDLQGGQPEQPASRPGEDQPAWAPPAWAQGGPPQQPAQPSTAGSTPDPNLVAIDRAGLSNESAAWLRQVAQQVDPRLQRVNPGWRSSAQADAARACAFGILLGHLARVHPHMAADLSRVAEVHPSFSTLLEGSRLATLEQIAADPGRATAWLGPLIDVEDRDRVAALLA